jgi:hypothetical protein
VFGGLAGLTQHFVSGELVGCSFRDVVSTAECTIKWNVTVINELWNITGPQ